MWANKPWINGFVSFVGILGKGIALAPDQLKIRELEKKIKRIEMEKEILKKASALLMSD